MPNARPVAIVTGISSGLGLEVGCCFLSRETTVVGVARGTIADPRWTQAERERRAVYVAGDVSNPETVDKAFTAAGRMGSIRHVVNIAGVGVFGPAGQYTPADLDRVLSGNLVGTVLFSERGFLLMRQHGGQIVNVMSTAAQVARKNEAIYCAAKWGARGYTESLRLEAKGTPVKVIAVYPGGMNTRFWSLAKGAQVDSSAFMDPAEVARIIFRAIDEVTKAYVSDLVINRP